MAAQVELAHVGPHGGLVIQRPEFSRAKRRGELQAAQCDHQLLVVGGVGFLDGCKNGLHGGIAHHRAHLGVFIEASVVIGRKTGVLPRIDLVPGVAGHDPALGRFIFQHIEVLGLARQQGHYWRLGENAALVAFPHQFGQIGAEGHIEDGVGLALHGGLQRGAGIQLAQRRPLLTHKLHIRPSGLQQFLEAGDSALPILIVGCDGGPAPGGQLGRLFDQHGCLHISTGAQAEGVTVTLVPHQGVGQRLAGHIYPLVFLCVIGERQTHIGQKAAGQNIHLFLRCQLDGMAQRFFGLAGIIARDHLHLAPQQPACHIDLFHGELPALAIGLGELRNGRVAVDFADFDRRL